MCELDRSKSTIHSHLRILEQCGYVGREGTEYRPGLRFLDVNENRRENYLDAYRASKEGCKTSRKNLKSMPGS